MATTTAVKRNEAPKFEDRIRFNWGYHDGLQAQRESWPYRTTHFDSVWLAGFQAGYYAAADGESTDTSDAAWKVYRQ